MGKGINANGGATWQDRRPRKKPDTSTNRYTLTFAAGQLPPANAFWSVTMYDGKTQLLIET